MTVREEFEAFWRKEYAFEMKRGEGRNGYGLKMFEGKYVSDNARFGYKIWCAAKGVKEE